MTIPKTLEPCPCDSGLAYEYCCGIAKRTAANADIVARLTTVGIETNGNLTAQMGMALESFETSPDLFPARIDFFQNKAWFVKMSPRWYSESVFLDPGRIRGTCVIESELERLQQMTQGITWQPSAFIFHTAFCGSTLMAQALGATYNCLPLREPGIVGNLLVYINSQTKGSKQEENDWLDRILRLLSRRYESSQPAVIKANDFDNPIMIKLLECLHDIPILFMYTPLAEFVVACLKADNRREWVRARYTAMSTHAPRLLNIPAGPTINDDSFAHMAAVYWCFNIALYLEAWRGFPEKLHSLDINVMLAQPRKSVEACGRLFGLTSLDSIDINERIKSLLGVYSKNKQMNYSPQHRTNDIARLLIEYKTEVGAAKQLAQQLLADNYPGDILPGHLTTN
ncbi:MAG: SEC-C domain-containing protein [Gammaproteobacteria bacterium]|nr:SEC-C domain-containing protein [Gammaproteobacteria bacterium]